MSREIKLEWYVLNEDFNDNHKIKPFNVFNNWLFRDEAIKLAKQYKKGEIKEWNWSDDFPKKASLFEQFKYALMRALAWQERGRCEYEIIVSSWLYGKDEAYEEKIDCYEQVLPNADIFAEYVLRKVNKTL